MLYCRVTNCKQCGILIQKDGFNVLKNEQEPFRKMKTLNRMKKIICRGQGECYAAVPCGKPTQANHWVFTGNYAGLCCYCALLSGWCSLSFQDVGCIVCKETLAKCEMFVKVQKSKTIWADLDTSLIQYILAFVIRDGRKAIDV